MNKDQIHKALVTFVVILIAASAIGYLFFPWAMLRVVGIRGDAQAYFFLRTLGAALLALVPGAWNARNGQTDSLYREVMRGLVIYMIVSSYVDWQAYRAELINQAAIPSIIFRLLLGGLLWWGSRS